MPEVYLLSWAFSEVAWGVLSVIVFIVVLLLAILILVQDSKDSGLTSAFGGGGGSALMGARMQKDLAKITAGLGIVLAICLVSMGLITAKTGRDSIGSAGATDVQTMPVTGAEGALPDPTATSNNPLGDSLKITTQPVTNTSSTPTPSGPSRLPATPVESPLNPEEKPSEGPSTQQK